MTFKSVTPALYSLFATSSILLAAASFLATPLAAQENASKNGVFELTESSDCEEPFDFGGDKLEVLDNVAIWTGNVRVVQCESILSTQRLDIVLNDQNNAERFLAKGKVRYVGGEDAISAKSAVYDLIARTITFTDNVVITQGDQVMTGGNLVYWLDTGQIEFAPTPGKRIRGIFYADSADLSL